MNKTHGKHITPEAMAQQWRFASNALAVNVWNFTIQAGNIATAVFRKSFEMGGFNTIPFTRWKQRTKKYPHPILHETGTLKSSITWKRAGSNKNSTAHIFTNPITFCGAKRHAGFCYAAVHNDPDGSHTYGASGVPSVQRQFIGHSEKLKQELKKIERTLFVGLPC